jgi:hypothetical protein
MSLLVANAGSSVQIANLNKFIRGMKKLGLDTQDLSGATTRIRSLVVPPAISGAPVRTGRLRNTVKARKYPNKVEVQAGNNTTVPYANPIHWGWKARNIKPNNWIEKVRDDKFQAVIQIFIEETEQVIKKAERITQT